MSSNDNSDRLPDSDALIRSETNQRRAVSVEWYFLYVDCFDGSRLFASRCTTKLLTTCISSSLETIDKLETGL